MPLDDRDENEDEDEVDMDDRKPRASPLLSCVCVTKGREGKVLTDDLESLA